MYTKRKDELRGRDLRYKLLEKLPLGPPVVGRANPGEEVCRLVHTYVKDTASRGKTQCQIL